MLNYKKIQAVCENISDISASFVDDFLLYYVAENEGLEQKIARQMAQYKSVVLKMPEAWPGCLMSQIIAHKIFKKDGFAHKYATHAAVLNRSSEELEYFKATIQHPWRFSFCMIYNNPADDFYEMIDVLTEESFLLYSPGMTQTIDERGSVPGLWFLLIGDNGACYQTYGTLVYFNGIQPFDIFFFAKQLNRDLMFVSEVSDMIEANPIPFAMIWVGGEIPITVHKKDLVVFNKSEFHVKEMCVEKYEGDFIIEKKDCIYMLSLKRWNTFPHFAKCFYHAKKNLFIITSMTTRGYGRLILALNKQGNEFPATPEVLATPAMLNVVKKVLNIDIDMNPYERHFGKQTTEHEEEELDRINTFIKSLIEPLNNQEDCDVANLAEKAGIELSVAKGIVVSLTKKMFKGGKR